MRKRIFPPKLLSAELHHFSLFTRQPIVEVSFGSGVFCLAGANGLGKSSFLIALNYGITGIVPDPERKFESTDEYYRFSIKYSSRFFSGRILEKERASAEIVLNLAVGPYLFSITRNMFEPTQLRDFKLYEWKDQYALVEDYSALTPEERHSEYASLITQFVGLESFDQLVFLQHFVFTFDERRHLLFWNPPVLERILYLAFGVEAKEADELMRERERADSLVRNAKWQATQVRRKIEDLEKEVAEIDVSADYEDLAQDHKRLSDERELAYKLVQKLQSELDDTEEHSVRLSSEIAAKRVDYEHLFSRLTESGGSAVEQHPLIVATLDNSQCTLCGSTNEHIAATIRDKIQSHVCPLCESNIEHNRHSSEEIVAELKMLDTELMALKEKYGHASTARSRIEYELADARKELDAIEGQLAGFEKANERELEVLQSTRLGTSVNIILQNYRKQLDGHLKDKDKAYAVREEKTKKLLKLQQGLEKQYFEAEEIFVPIFRQLAQSFLGLSLNVRLETKKGVAPEVSLLLDVANTPRRQQHQLSESQKFFVDIALRMALIEYVADPKYKGNLLVDTPEGSLDIAYESRAGDMFANFVESGYDLIMTANINTSQLLIRMAERCGKASMKIVRMTSWTELSDVQIQEEELFEKAYQAMEHALDNG